MCNHNDGQSDEYVKFSEKSLKQLRNRQNEQIDKIYLTFKNPVPFKFQFVMDEYIRQLCIKNEKVSKEDMRYKSKRQLQELALEILEEAEDRPIRPNFLTEMKGIDYEKITDYLNALEEKKLRK